MFSTKLSILLFTIILFSYSKLENSSEEDYDDGENDELEDCQYEIDFKT